MCELKEEEEEEEEDTGENKKADAFTHTDRMQSDIFEGV